MLFLDKCSPVLALYNSML